MVAIALALALAPGVAAGWAGGLIDSAVENALVYSSYVPISEEYTNQSPLRTAANSSDARGAIQPS